MENTNCGNNCPFVKSGLCENDEGCPNYLETVWVEAQTNQKKIVKDCSPKRLQMQNAQQNQRILGLQEAIEQQRNSFEIMCGNFGALLNQIQTLALEQKRRNDLLEAQGDKKQLPLKSDDKDDAEKGD